MNESMTSVCSNDLTSELSIKSESCEDIKDNGLKRHVSDSNLVLAKKSIYDKKDDLNKTCDSFPATTFNTFTLKPKEVRNRSKAGANNSKNSEDNKKAEALQKRKSHLALDQAKINEEKEKKAKQEQIYVSKTRSKKFV